MTVVLTYEALKAERDALAVENAEMRGVIDAAIGVANNSSGIAGWHLNGEIADWDEILPELNIETPATDAALAAIQAQGVEKFADMCREKSKLATTADSCAGWKNCSVHASSFAIRLREAK